LRRLVSDACLRTEIPVRLRLVAAT
jgi:hypothetical protein